MNPTTFGIHNLFSTTITMHYNREYALAHSTGTRAHLIPSPWGTPDSARWVGVGVVWVNTPRHEGFILSQPCYDAMPVCLKAASWTKDQAFEGDAAADAVLVAFPWLFDDAAVEKGRQRLRHSNPDVYEQWAALGFPTAAQKISRRA